MTAVQYISQLPSAATPARTDLVPVTQGSTGALSGTTRKLLMSAFADGLPVLASGSTTSRTLAARFANTYYAADFGAVEDGVTDDTAAFQAAIDVIAAAGGGTLRYVGRPLIDSDLVLKDYVTLQGPLGLPDEILPATAADYDGRRGAIILNSAATIRLLDSASLTNALIVRKGLDLPFANAAAATAGVAAFAGTAITVGGSGATIEKIMVLGFNQLLNSDGYERVRCRWVQGDCTNGIRIVNCADISYLSECHMWPYTTTHQSWTTNALLHRSGFAYRMQTLGDWNKITSCFSYGYFRGFQIDGCNNVTLLGCGSDNTGAYSGSIGVLVDGASTDTQLIGHQAAGQTHGILCQANANTHTRLLGVQTWGNTNTGIVVSSGDVTVQESTIRGSTSGINVLTNLSTVRVSGNRFAAIGAGGPVASAASPATPYIFIDCDNIYFDWPAGTSVTDNTKRALYGIASASPLVLPATGSVFSVTGTTSFSAMNGGWHEREVTLIFADVLTITSSATLTLKSSPTTTAAGTALRFVFDGTAWRQL